MWLQQLPLMPAGGGGWSDLSPPELFNLKLVSRRWREIIISFHPHHLDLRQFNCTKDYKKAIDCILPKMPWLHGLRGLDLQDVKAVQKSCEHLKAIEICQESKDKVDLKQLCAGFPSLQEVTLPKPTTDAEVEMLLKSKPGLRKLVLNRTEVTGVCLQHLSDSIEYLSMRYCDNLLPIHKIKFPRCPRMQEVDMAHWKSEGKFLGSDAGLEMLLECCPGLTKLNIDNEIAITGTSFQMLPSGLKDMSMAWCKQVQSACLRHVAKCTQLRHLNLFGMSDLQDADVGVVLAGCQRLIRLNLTCTPVTGACLAQLPRTLERLVLDRCESLHSASLVHLSQCDQLRWLDVSRVPDVQSAHLAAALLACTHLKRLEAKELTCPLEECLPEDGLAALRSLNVEDSDGVTDSTLAVLPDRLPHLHELSLYGCARVTETGQMHLHRFQSLRRLDLRLNLREASVTDAVLDQLHGTGLETLFLNLSSMGAVSDEAVIRLALGCPSITEMLLLTANYDEFATSVCGELVDRLAKQLPRGRVLTLGVHSNVMWTRPDLEHRSRGRFSERFRGRSRRGRSQPRLMLAADMCDLWNPEWRW